MTYCLFIYIFILFLNPAHVLKDRQEIESAAISKCPSLIIFKWLPEKWNLPICVNRGFSHSLSPSVSTLYAAPNLISIKLIISVQHNVKRCEFDQDLMTILLNSKNAYSICVL